jgi:hypothetical protein
VTAAAFHLDPNDGTPRRCGRPNECGWAAPEDHRATPEQVREQYEQLMAAFAIPRFRKSGGRERQSHVMEYASPVR